MAFPQTNLGAKVQLKINGTWTDATRYDAKTRILLDQGIVINRGKSNVQDRTPASTCNWTWLDPNGIYNNENPRSPYYGLLGRNLPVRVVVPRATPSLLIVNHLDGANSSAPHTTALGITGDIDIRIEIEPRTLTRFGGASGQIATQLLASKSTQLTGGISWYFRLYDDGRLAFIWSTTGSNQISQLSTAPVPMVARQAVRVQLDVDNGSGGYTVTFATASSINGTYTTLGAPVVTTAGITSVFNATTASVELGTYANGSASFAINSTTQNFYGRIYGFQLRNGLGGTLVASPDFTAQANGTTSFSDGLGNTWTNKGVAEITDADYRFHGELSAPKVTPNTSFNGVGVDVRCDAEAGGLIRRLTQNATPVRSALYRTLSNYTPVGFWPGEDTSGATTAASAVATLDAAVLTDITFAGYDSTLPGSAGVMTMGSTGPYFNGTVRSVPGTNSEFHFVGFFRFPTVPLSAQTLFSVFGTGTVKRWDFIVDNVQYTLRGYDASGANIVTKQNGFGQPDPTNWTGVHFGITQSGGNVNITFQWMSYSNPTINLFGGFDASGVGTTSYAGTVGAFNRVLIQGVAALSGVKIAQLALINTSFTWSGGSFFQYAVAYSGETADQRFKRVLAEQGMFYNYIGRPGDTNNMGPQPIDTLMNILYECQEVENGQLIEARDQLVLEFRSRNSLSNQTGTTLSYVTNKHLAAQMKSTPDDTGIANDITLSRKNGSSARATLTAGPMSIQAPPNGIGLVPDSPTINNYTDIDLPYLAQYRLGVSTWPEARYPQVQVAMHRTAIVSNAALFLALEGINLGDRLIVGDLPQFMPAEPISLMIQGQSETLKNVTWDITWNTTPYGPYLIGQLNTAVTGLNFRLGQDTINGVSQTQLAAAVNAVATSFSIATLSGPLLSTTAGDYPADAFFAGERVTITAVTGSSSPQTATVTRSVNGIVKSQLINEAMIVVQMPRLSLNTAAG